MQQILKKKLTESSPSAHRRNSKHRVSTNSPILFKMKKSSFKLDGKRSNTPNLMLRSKLKNFSIHRDSKNIVRDSLVLKKRQSNSLEP